MKNVILLLLTLVLSFNSFAQQKSFTLNWQDRKNISSIQGEKWVVPAFQEENFEYQASNGQIYFTAQWEDNGYIASSKVTQISYENIARENLNNLDLEQIPTQIEYRLKSTRARNENYIHLELNPLINDHGTYKRITSFTVNYETSLYQTLDDGDENHTPPISDSKLAHGDIFKFQIDKTGIYKINRSFLSSLGMDVSSIDPRKIKIYGHGGAMLPLRNSDNFYYDPPEVAIQVIGEGDGSFDNDDYILFYGIGTEGNWSKENYTNLNLYDDNSYYYITAHGEDGKRISELNQPTNSTTHQINTFDDEQFYEVDLTNIGKVGRTWFGDQFDVRNNRNYDFEFPNIVQGSQIRTVIHVAATSESATSFKVSVNGNVTGTTNLSASTKEIFAREKTDTSYASASSDNVKVNLTYQNNGNPASVGYLDFLNIKAERHLKATDKQFLFKKLETQNLVGIGKYRLENASNVSAIWDVTDPYNIKRIPGSGNQIEFKAELGTLGKYQVLVESDLYSPIKPRQTRIDNVNIKGNVFKDQNGNFQDVDYLIVTPEKFLNQVTRIADIRQNRDGLNTKIVVDQDVYTEFSSGKQDIGAIRNLVKYIYDNASSPDKRIKYLLLMGNASIDYKDRLENNHNLIPTFESLYSYSLSHSSTASDDFFGMMDPAEGQMESVDKLDIAVGRIPADDQKMAKLLVDKIIDYESEKSYGEWRNNFILISDDADDSSSGGAGLQFSLDALGDLISENKPFINVKKIHSDAYEQVYTSGGQRYPEVNKAITENIEVGATVVNYFGHGGEDGLASEFIVTRDDIKGWSNKDRYNIFITVTCEFTRFDNPLRVSPGELSLHNERGGSVALVSTTRTIPVPSGTSINNQLAPNIFNFENQGYTVAEALRRTKNSVSGISRRVVFFFGDPAMHIALPDPEIKLTAINDKPLSQPQDTLKALSKVKISGEVVNANGNLLSNYNGTLTSTVFDKPIERHTLGNDGATDNNGNLIIMDFATLGNVVFRGDASVKEGKFDFEFVVPKDIRMPVGEGRVSFYSKQNGVLQDNKGYNNEILVGGINENAPEDNQGPEIELYMNDESFVAGGMTDSSPIILAKLSDENGINTTSGIGHDIVAYLDGDETNPIILNDYYKAEEDDYTRGKVNYNLHDLEKGPHTLTFRAWDVYNNSSSAELSFMVTEDDELKIEKVLNYPNPFHDYTEFWFNHNRPFEPLEVMVQVFTVSGKLVWTKSEVVNTEGFLSRDITWDGRDDFGSAIGKGVYVYKLSVRSTLTNQKAEKYEKLVIL